MNAGNEQQALGLLVFVKLIAITFPGRGERLGALFIKKLFQDFKPSENQQSKRLLLVARIHFSSQVHAARFFGQYSELLEKKHQQRTNLFRRPDFFSFDTPEGGVFLRCSATDCLVVEGGERSVFVELNKQLDLGPVPEPDQKLGATPTKTVSNVMPVVEATER